MKIYLVTMGSRGDNEPFRALALEAARRGHEVHFAHTDDLLPDQSAPYTDWALPGSLEGLIAEQGVSALRALRDYTRVWKPTLQAIFDESTRHIRDIQPDVVVYHPKVLTAPVIAHEVGAHAVIVEMVPMLTPTREFAAAGIPMDLPGWLNRASYQLIDLGIAAFGDPAKKLARSLRVDSWRADASVCPVSTALVAQPGDWPPTSTITGPWRVPGSENLAPELAEFLHGSRVLYAGFGSMKRGDARRRAELTVQAARHLSLKTLLVTGWGGLDPSDELASSADVFVAQSVPHDTVLEQVTAGIHHGGSGTVHAFLAAGVPSVIMPFLADQPWWAWRGYRAGLGPRALSPNCRSVSRLTKALDEAMALRPAVEQVARRMRQENGVATAIDAIERTQAA